MRRCSSGRSVGLLRSGEDLSDATVQFQVISQLADPTTPFRVIDQPTSISGHVHGDQGQAELRSLIHSVLAGLTPREREVIELSFRHDLDDNDLAIVLGLSRSRAHALASRARGLVEEALVHCTSRLPDEKPARRWEKSLTDWDEQLTEETRDLVVRHIGECKTCAQHGLAQCVRRRFPACCRWHRCTRSCASRS